MGVDVVQQLRSEAHFGPHVIEDRRNGIDVKVFIERPALVAAFRATAFIGANETAAAVAALAVL